MTPSDLTPRQLEVAALVASGHTTKQVAAKLGISYRRVQVLMASIAYHLNLDQGMDDRVLIALWWWKVNPKPESDAA